MSVETDAPSSDFAIGLGILLLAQITAAYMGAFVEDTYATYKATWDENLFWGHALSIPMFLPFSGTLQRQYARLSRTPPLKLTNAKLINESLLPQSLQTTIVDFVESTPQGVLFLLINAVTQLACISGVNLLSAKSSAVTVTIVLNIRKLVSFILSTLIFGHHLSGKMIVGSALVFGSGALYSWETSWRLPRERKARAIQNRSIEKIK